jgi:peptide-methionine (S)-S-oxide reductase
VQNLFPTRETTPHALAAPLDALAPKTLATATFGVGCFWTPDARFGLVEGVWRTRVGYAGGEQTDPIYRDIRDHTECFQVDFDPSVISYRELVDRAFAAHNPAWVAPKTQYASLVLTHGAEQLEIARERAARASSILGRPLATRIEPLKQFWIAEDYHQKYYLRSDRLLAGEFSTMFCGEEGELRESTSAARVNGYLAGNGTRSQLAREIEFFGLTEGGRSRLVSRVADEPSLGGECAIG